MTADPRLTGHRSPYRRYDLVDKDGGVIAPLKGVRGATFDQSASATLKRGGNMQLTDLGQDIDWLTARIRAVYGIEGYGEWGLGVYLTSIPSEQWSGGVRRWDDIQLLDVGSVLAEHGIEDGYQVQAGANVTDAIRELIASTGETSIAITDSDKTLTTGLAWEPGESVLRIVNQLTDAIGYFAATTDGDGHHLIEPYARPQQRPIEWEFIDGQTCIYRPTFERTRNLTRIPNHQMARTRGTGDETGLVVNVYNRDPDSPYSTVRRGHRISADIIEAEAADEEALRVLATRALHNQMSRASVVTIDAMPTPLDANAMVRFRSIRAGVDAPHVVQNISYGPKKTDLATYTLREVVDLNDSE